MNHTRQTARGLLIAAVDPHGIAFEMGIEAGDRVVSVDGRAITDILDFQYGISEDAYTLVIAKAGDGPAQNRPCPDDDLFCSADDCSADDCPADDCFAGDELWEIDIERNPDEYLGISFAEIAVDGMKRCRNNCVFCFVRQMPPGLRAPLYEFDDDYRMSVSRGNYITLTNLTEEEFERILALRISPLYISVHAWDPRVRARMMGNPAAAELPEQLRRLTRAGLVIHTQIVLVPGWNDGTLLQETVRELAALYPYVRSIGIVPVGLTRFRLGLNPLRTLTAEECRGILEEGETWQRNFRRLHGRNLVCFADEFYLACGRAIPPPEEYDGFEQLENGIGMLSSFEDDLLALLGETELRSDTGCLRPGTGPLRPGTGPLRPGAGCPAAGLATLSRPRHLITGILAEPFLRQCLDRVLRHAAARHKPVHDRILIHGIRNDFFGPQITVAGLVTATDIAAQLGSLEGEEFVVPRVMLRADSDEFLDGHDIPWLEKRLGGTALIVDAGAGGLVQLTIDN